MTGSHTLAVAGVILFMKHSAKEQANWWALRMCVRMRTGCAKKRPIEISNNLSKGYNFAYVYAPLGISGAKSLHCPSVHLLGG